MVSQPLYATAKDGTELFVQDWGSGRPVLFLAAWTFNSSIWGSQIVALNAKGYRCVAPDRRGHGRSDMPATGYDLDTLTDNWESGESNWLSWYRRDDQYSREKLSGDLEKLNNFYLDRGYVDFSIDSTQVAISPDRRDMYLTAGLTEGEIREQFAEYPAVIETLEKDNVHTQDEALLDIYRKLRPGEPPTKEAAQTLLDNLYFNPKRYDLAKVGRYKINKKLGLSQPFDQQVLTIDDIVAANERMAEQLEHVGQVVGREGQTRQRVNFGLASGAWADMESSVNTLIDDLLWPTREVTRAVAAVAQGDLLQTVQLDVEGRPLRGEFLQSANIVNTMIKQLSVFTSEVTRVAREVGTEGKLGGQAQVPEVTGVWKDLTESVNSMANNLTGQVRNIAEVTIAVANGDLSKKITVDVRGEILQLKEAINTMVDQLRSFASEVTRVAREIGRAHV